MSELNKKIHIKTKNVLRKKLRLASTIYDL